MLSSDIGNHFRVIFWVHSYPNILNLGCILNNLNECCRLSHKSDEMRASTNLFLGFQVYSAHTSLLRLPAVSDSQEPLVVRQGTLLGRSLRLALLLAQRRFLLHQEVVEGGRRK